MAECPSEEQLAGYVAGICTDEQTATIDAHLSTCTRCGEWVERARAADVGQTMPSDQLAETQASAEEAAPETPSPSIPGYELVKEAHRGGQGVVYQAIQKSTKRRVAIKVMHEGPFAGPPDKARFEREVQVLGQLNHPNIVNIHDSGTAAGSFYYVMDYISGRSLDDYVTLSKPSLDDTLRLFAKICEAVNAAHLRGVIHRDLKPSNIRIDADGEPHILDFGLAKIATGQVTEGTRPQVMTLTGQFFGSLPWASPEQAEAIPSKIDLRTDVYSLGVIFYHMLTARFPYKVVGNIRDVMDRIMNTEPARPSTIRVAAGPRAGRINDEIDTIVLKSLAKERDRRYQSAGELGRDVRHYLAGEPIEAKRDSAWYVLKKSLRRYKVPAAFAASLMVLITLALGVSVSLWQNAVAAEESAKRERDAAREAQAAEAAARAETENARQAEAEQRKLTEEHAARLRRTVYRNYIALADVAYHAGDILRMRELLDLCPSDLRGWEWGRLNWCSDRSVLTLRGHALGVSTVSFSPDGKRIVSGSADRTLIVWDAATGEEMITLRGHAFKVSAVAFSPDGRRIVSGCYDGTLKVWDSATGEETLTLIGDTRSGHTRSVYGVAFSPDGQRIVSGSRDGTLKVWDAATGEETLTLRGHSHAVFAVAFSPDGQRIVSGSRDDTLKVWDAATAEETLTLRGHADMVSSVSFSPDGKRIVSGSWDGTLKVWDAATGEEMITLRGHTRDVTSVAFSPDGSRIVSGSYDGTLKVWDAATGAETLTLRGHAFEVCAVAFSPDGRRIVSGSYDGTLKLWDAAAGEQTLTLRGHTSEVRSVGFSPDGQRIMSGSRDKTLKVWDAATGAETLTLRVHAFEVYAVGFSPDGRRIVSGSCGPTLKVWDAATGDETLTLRGHADEVSSVVFSPDGSRIVSGSYDGTLRVWDAAAGEETLTLRGHAEGVSCVAFSPDGSRIVSGSTDGTLKVWDGGTAE